MQYTGACFTKHYSEPTDLKKKFERNSPPMFLCVRGMSWDELLSVKGRKQNTVEFQTNSYGNGPVTIYRVGGKGGGRLLRGVLGLKGGKKGDQSSLTEFKGEDMNKIDWLTLREEGVVIRILQSFRGGSGQCYRYKKKLSDSPRAIDNDQSLSGCLRINWVVKMSIKFHEVYTPDGHMLENILIDENFSCNINVSPQPTSCNLERMWGS